MALLVFGGFRPYSATLFPYSKSDTFRQVARGGHRRGERAGLLGHERHSREEEVVCATGKCHMEEGGGWPADTQTLSLTLSRRRARGPEGEGVRGWGAGGWRVGRGDGGWGAGMAGGARGWRVG